MVTTQTSIARADIAEQLNCSQELTRQISEMGEWFHNINLHGVLTAPNHFLGDFPNIKWKSIAPTIPEDLSGLSVLDIGCNGGFYSIELKKRGASRVLGVDVDDRYLDQARFAAQVLGLDIELAKCSVYDVDSIAGQFDYVLFMGVFYHLRYPLYALDKVIKKVKGTLVFQTMIRGALNSPELKDDYHFWNTEIFSRSDFPCMYFIEKNYAGDPTNWWIPNHGAMEAMLRSSGLEIKAHPEQETWLCAPSQVTKDDGKFILDHQLAGTL
ncbi:MAG TPA: TIGR04290 family methyltransferase [Candidatus Angelobacter sp.]|nr:TIGR04290 family methyltransferase [Candidatus Angelobacter sp.]